ncbi:MAG: 2OG-Fe(II) oxygenase [Burkholderiaceae bacterium]
MIGKYPYWCFNEELSSKFCAEIIKFGNKLGQDVSGGLYEKGATIHDDVMRKSRITWINSKEIIEIFKMYIEVANHKAGWNFDVCSYEVPQFSKYEEGGHYDWHIDTGVEGTEENLYRKLSISVNLNEDYEGGEFEIERWCPPNSSNRSILVKEMANAGSVVVFPSFLHHRVKPVKKGIRHSLVGWFRGPPFE